MVWEELILFSYNMASVKLYNNFKLIWNITKGGFFHSFWGPTGITIVHWVMQ